MRKHLSLIAVTGILCGGCGYASIFSQNSSGGVLALHGAESKAMEDANLKMGSHCGGRGYEVVSRDTVVVGQQESTDTNTDYAEKTDSGNKPKPKLGFGGGSTSETKGQAKTTSTTTTTNINEVRLTYVCGGSQPAPAPAPAAPEAPADAGAEAPAEPASAPGA